jgi:hypothetical protein
MIAPPMISDGAQRRVRSHEFDAIEPSAAATCAYGAFRSLRPLPPEPGCGPPGTPRMLPGQAEGRRDPSIHRRSIGDPSEGSIGAPRCAAARPQSRLRRVRPLPQPPVRTERSVALVRSLRSPAAATGDAENAARPRRGSEGSIIDSWFAWSHDFVIQLRSLARGAREARGRDLVGRLTNALLRLFLKHLCQLLTSLNQGLQDFSRAGHCVGFDGGIGKAMDKVASLYELLVAGEIESSADLNVAAKRRVHGLPVVCIWRTEKIGRRGDVGAFAISGN